jgi:hypothetical protein
MHYSDASHHAGSCVPMLSLSVDSLEHHTRPLRQLYEVGDGKMIAPLDKPLRRGRSQLTRQPRFGAASGLTFSRHDRAPLHGVLEIKLRPDGRMIRCGVGRACPPPNGCTAPPVSFATFHIPRRSIPTGVNFALSASETRIASICSFAL